jgi:hypothetical protein
VRLLDDVNLTRSEWEDVLDEIPWFDVQRPRRQKLPNNYYVMQLKNDLILWDRDDWDAALSHETFSDEDQ